MSRHHISCGAGLAVLLLGACTTTTPSTTETTGPKMVLNITDLTNHVQVATALPQMKHAAAGAPDNGFNIDPSDNNHYNDMFVIIATDPGGVASLTFSSTFVTEGPCNPNFGYQLGTSASGSETTHKAPDGTVPEQLDGLIFASAANENMALGCPANSANDPPGVYVITATATNYSNVQKKATWYINVGPATSVPVQPNEG